jgi:hypothetical protein
MQLLTIVTCNPHVSAISWYEIEILFPERAPFRIALNTFLAAFGIVMLHPRMYDGA